MTLWRSVATRTRSHLVPRFVGVVSQRFYAEDHNPSPKCSAAADSGKGCGKFHGCGDPRYEKKEPPPQEDTFQFHHLVKMPADCCDDPCRERYPPYDQCYYEISDKAKRKYQVTWVECPPIQIKPKKICCFEAAKHPPITRRKRKEFVADAKCPQEETCPVASGPCPKITLPGCKAVKDTSCYIVRRKTDCTKVKAPYPSFSECSHAAIRKPRGIECNCLAVPSACDLLRETMKNEGNPRKGNCGGSRG
ncbi:uncharacterized protein LOC108090373 [Drosophila ficusphila]|uniref:uncharacterized protein LOC108090373 n=1 Tax=Drosophila ficusphila TaxID=30025 RepID=UPI0007E70770|nr:uncharacterized protein LOC108090373 [Drosophila ficusphila]